MPSSPPSPSELFAPGLLDGQVALVTGGGTGLGRATAAELIACGARVVLAGRRAEVLEATAERLGSGASWVAGDIRSEQDAERLVATVLERHGRLDLLVNNAGGQYFVPAEAIAARGWRAVVGLNVGGTARMTELAVERAMRPAGRGTIVNVTLSPHHGLAGMAHSSAARAAVESLTRAWAQRWAADGIAVVAVAAGHFQTDALDKYPEPVRASVARMVPLQRLGQPREHGWLVALLASPLGRSLSGTTITLDGARDNWCGPWPPATVTDADGNVPSERRAAAQTR